MLDIKFIRENPKKVKEGCQKKQVKVDIDKLLKLDGVHRKLLQDIEALRAQKNKASGKIAQAKGKEKIKLINEMKEVDAKTDHLEPKLKKVEEEFGKLILQVPNLPLDEVPVGKDESENKVVRQVGDKPKFDFKPKDYMEIAEKLDLIDTKRAAKVAGSRFGYIKNEATLLEFALIQFAFNILTKEGFIPVVPPVMLNEKAMRAMGYLERGSEEVYQTKQDGLYLVGTSEQSVGTMHMEEVFKESDLPRRYAAFSTCFRREAGSYGKDTKGILRVHQFDKVEMFSFTKPQDSTNEHQFLLSTQEKIVQALKLPYQVVQMCTGDLGDPAANKIDIECWMPGQGTYRETHSTSNCTDFQARRLNIRYKSTDGLNYTHTLNGTAVAIGRLLIAIIENYQQKDGSVKIPEALKPYLGGLKVIKVGA